MAREGRCSRSRSRLRRALPPALVMGHTTRIRGRSCWTGKTGKGRRREAPGHAAGSSSRAHSMLERSVLFTYFLLSPLCLALSENGVHWFTDCCCCSGLPLLPRCTSHTPSWPTRRSRFLSPVYLNDMYVRQFGKKVNADQELRISTLFLFQTQMDMYIHGKEIDFGASISLFAFF